MKSKNNNKNTKNRKLNKFTKKNYNKKYGGAGLFEGLFRKKAIPVYEEPVLVRRNPADPLPDKPEQEQYNEPDERSINVYKDGIINFILLGKLKTINNNQPFHISSNPDYKKIYDENDFNFIKKLFDYIQFNAGFV